MKFLKLNSGAILNLAHVILIKAGELHLISGNKVPLIPADEDLALKSIEDNFLRLSNGSLVNPHHIVQLTPPFHIQLTSGNVITLSGDDAGRIEKALLDTPIDRILRSIDRDQEATDAHIAAHDWTTSPAPAAEPLPPASSLGTAAPEDSVHSPPVPA